MEAAFSALNDSFADIGLGKAMIEKAVIEYDIPILEDKREVSRDQELSEDEELDLDLLLADLDKAITLATERTASGTVEQEIAYASGTRNRKKSAASSHCSTPQYTPQKSRTPRLTPGQTPGSSKVNRQRTQSVVDVVPSTCLFALNTSVCLFVCLFVCPLLQVSVCIICRLCFKGAI